MKWINALNWNKAYMLIAGGTLLWGLVAPSTASAVDAYVLYDGKSKKEKKTFLAALPKALSVKSYNVDLLAVADYSGKQKAISKFQKASVVVILLDGPMKVLKGSTVKKDLIIVNSKMATVKSDSWRLHVLAKGTDISKIGKRLKTLEASKTDALQKFENLEPVDVVLVDGDLDLLQAGAIVTETILGQ